MYSKQVSFYNQVGFHTTVRYHYVVESTPHKSANWAICVGNEGYLYCFSYGTLIGVWDGTSTGVWLNPVKYSATSSKHMTWFRRWLDEKGWDGKTVQKWETHPESGEC